MFNFQSLLKIHTITTTNSFVSFAYITFKNNILITLNLVFEGNSTGRIITVRIIINA